MELLPPQRDWPGSEVPEPESSRHRRITAGLILTSIIATLAYLVWRVTFTIDPTSALLGIPLLILELWSFLTALVYGLVLWDLDAIRPPSPRHSTHLTTTVLITTVNEPPEVLMPTLLGAQHIALVDQVWVLDDGDRDWVRAACAELGLVWRTRPDHDHAKAGNINAALADVETDLVVVLDADHVASPNLLAHTLGYFDDPKVALVQTPQDFYNENSFEHDVLGTRVMNEEELFYRAMAAGRNRWNAAFWVGTSGVLRVAALKGIGGVATTSVTEDIQTTIVLQRNGWHTVHHNEVLARGLAAADARQYLTQRLRWGTGAMQVLRNERFMTRPGLTTGQRICYLATLLGWWDSWRTLALLILPALSLLLGSFPFSTSFLALALFFGTSFGLQQTAMWRLSRRRSTPWRSMIFDAIKLPATLRATLTIFSGRPRPFHVTHKGREGTERATAAVPRLLWALIVLPAVALAVFIASIIGWLPERMAEPWLAWLTLLWLAFNILITVKAIRRIRDSRFASERRASVRLDVRGRALLGQDLVEIGDLSLGGARLLGGPIHVEREILPFTVSGTSLAAIVTRSRVNPQGHAMTQVQFLPGQEVSAARVLSPLLVAGPPAAAEP